MSTSETTSHASNACPCGKGKIIKHVTTQDNPWSSADISYELACDACRPEWRMDHGSDLIKTSSETPHNAAADVRNQAWNKVKQIASPLIDSYFNTHAPKSKKAQWEKMKELDVFAGSYKDYLNRRNAGEAPGEIAYGIRNPEWLLSLAPDNNSRQELENAITAHRVAKKASGAAAGKIVRWPKESK